MGLFAITSVRPRWRRECSPLVPLGPDPVGDLISVPFTNYTNFNVGPNERTQGILPKLPVKLEVGAYYNALCPTGAGTWQLLTEVALVF